MKTYSVMTSRGSSSWINGLPIDEALKAAIKACKTIGAHPYLVDEESDEVISLADVGTRAAPIFEVV